MKYLLPLAACLAAPAVAADDAPPPVLEEGFEQLEEGLPEGWADRSTGGLVPTYGGERRGAAAGKRSLRVRVPQGSGEARLSRGGISLAAGKTYHVQLWLRSPGGLLPVEVALHPDGAAARPLASRRLAVGEEWRRCTLQMQIPDGASSPLAFSIIPRGTGALLVDALRMAEGPVPADTREPRKRNRVYNGSFELGADGWRSGGLLSAVAEGGAANAGFARMKGGQAALETRPFPVRPEMLYTVSMFLRSAQPGARVEVAAEERGGEFRAAQTFPLTAEWRRFSYSAPLPGERGFTYSVTLRGVDGAPFDVDAVQIEEGDLSDYHPGAPLEAAAVLSRSQLLVKPDTLLTFPVKVHAPGKAADGMEVRCTLQGFYGESLAFGGAPVPEGATHAEVPVRLRVPFSGPLRLVTEGMVNGEPVSRSEVLLTALPDEPAPESDTASLPTPGAVPPLYSWSGEEERARAATRSFARDLVLRRAAGQPLPHYRRALKAPAYLDENGLPTAALAALAAAERTLRGAAPAGRLETPLLNLYLFRRGDDTLAALWAGKGSRTPLPVALKLDVLGPRAFNVMGNPKGIVTEMGTVGVAVTEEPVYVVLPGVSPAAVTAAIRAAAEELAKPKLAPKKPEPEKPKTDGTG